MRGRTPSSARSRSASRTRTSVLLELFVSRRPCFCCSSPPRPCTASRRWRRGGRASTPPARRRGGARGEPMVERQTPSPRRAVDETFSNAGRGPGAHGFDKEAVRREARRGPRARRVVCGGVQVFWYPSFWCWMTRTKRSTRDMPPQTPSTRRPSTQVAPRGREGRETRALRGSGEGRAITCLWCRVRCRLCEDGRRGALWRYHQGAGRFQ